MRRTFRKLPPAFAAPGLGLLVLACVPIFVGGIFQTLSLTFELTGKIDAGEERLVHTAVFPDGVKVKRTFVRVSGRLTPPGNAELPERVIVKATVEDMETGAVRQTVAVTVDVDGEGFFTGSKKIKKNVGAGQMMMVTVEPRGADLPNKTEIALCIDLVKRKPDLRSLPDCVEGGGGGGGGGDPQAALSSIQNDILSPSCAVAGCHSAGSASAGLSLAAGASFGALVNVPSSQVPSLNRVTPNNPDASYLVKKLRGDADIQGARMPNGSPPLSAEQLDRIVRWINAGAPNN